MLRANYKGILGLALVLLAPVAIGDTDASPWREQGSAYEQAREAVRRGDALPLHRVRAYLRRVAPGKIVATEYEYEFDRWVYEFKIVDPQGRLRKVHLDARTGELVKVSDY